VRSISPWLAALFPLILQGCAPSYLVREDRVKPELGRFDDLMLSTYWLRWESRIPNRIETGRIGVSFQAMVQNTAKADPYELDLKGARFEMKGGGVPARCSAKPVAGDKSTLAPGAKSMLDCSAEIAAGSAPGLTTSDQFAALVVPYSGARKSGQLRMRYKIKAEDFHP
jgi:hypothetical protein